MVALELDSPIGEVGGWAKRYVEPLRGMGIETVADLVHHYPRAYIDRSRVAKIADLRPKQEATFIGTVKKVMTQRIPSRYGRGSGKTIVTVRVYDGTGLVDLSWFNQTWPARRHKEGQEVAVSGKVTAFRGKLRVQQPAVEVLKGGDADHVHVGRIVPVHPATEGVSTGVIRRLVHDALSRIGEMPDPVPPAVRERNDLPELHTAVRHIISPTTTGTRTRPGRG